jgi:endonuclease/exonuclease/phosphatase (EEP) superfamily protein YafD
MGGVAEAVWLGRYGCAGVTVRRMSGQQTAARPLATDGWLIRLPVTFAVLGLAGAVALLGVVSWFGDLHWTIELTSHFRVYYFLLGGLLALSALGLGMRIPAAILGLIAVANGVAAWPYLAPPKPLVLPATAPHVRVLWSNLANWSTDLPALKDLIEHESPDIAVLTELAADQEATLSQLRAVLPFQSRMPDGGALELMLLSKTAPEIVHFDLAGGHAPLLAARICPGGRACLTVLGLHTSRPFPFADGARNRQLEYAAGVARRHIERGERVILVGDLNVTPFSPVFHRLLLQSGLDDSTTMLSARPRAAVSTWWLRNTGIGLPIDHALLGPGVWLLERRLGTPVGSDHLPLIVDVRLDP